MTIEEFNEVWRPAILSLRINSYELDDALGIEEFSDYTINDPYVKPDPPLPENLAQLLRQLAGPHAKTILKAYRIKKGLE